MTKKINGEKTYSILKKVMIVLGAIIIVELAYMLISSILTNKRNVYRELPSSVIKSDSNYIVVGSSDFKNSKLTAYNKKGYEKAYIAIYDELNKIKEYSYTKGYNSQFNDIVEVSDGYIVVGQIEVTKKHNEENSGEGIIIKYDKNFKIVWQHNYQVLGKTSFKKVIALKDGSYLVAGQSIYESDYIGNHTTGGAILVKYSKDGKELSKINLGGPKNGIFNDVVEVDGGYIAVGKISTNTGIIVKYDYNGNIKWKKYHGYTDDMGLTSIEKLDNKYLIITGSYTKSKEDLENVQAIVLKYDYNGNMLKENKQKFSSLNRYEQVLIDDDKIVVIGVYGSLVDKTVLNKSVIIIYNSDLDKEKTSKFEYNKNDSFRSIIKDKNDYLVVGYSNSKIKEYKLNGKDVMPIFVKYDSSLETKE